MQRPPHGEPEPQPIVSAREARARDRARRGAGAATLYLRQLGRTEFEWLRGLARRTAANYSVDADDLLQELLLDLWTCEGLDQGRIGFRSWLDRRARWRALDMLRSGHLKQSVPADPVDLAMIGECPAAPGLGDEVPADWDLDRLRELGLTGNEARLVTLILWGLDLPLKQVAEQIGRTYTATRKDRSRGLRRIRDLFDLDPEEEAAFVAVREYRGIEAAAVRLGVDADELRRRFRDAEGKIGRILGSGSDADGRDMPPAGANLRGDIDG